ncbi:MAG: class I tRNA ligase family protein [Streptococcus salivarius]
MIRDRGDWVISSACLGCALPIFYAEDKTPIMTEETIEHVAKLFEEHGSVIWWERDARSSSRRLYTSGSQTESSLKKLTLWTYGLTQVHHGMVSLLTVLS